MSAQGGSIYGKVFDDSGQAIYSANISLVDGPTTTGTTSDFDGEFKIKPLSAGTYTVEITYLGYQSAKITGVQVYNNKITFLEDVNMTLAAYVLEGDYDVIDYKVKLIDPDEPQKMTISNELIIKTPGAKNPAMLARAYQSDVQVVNNQMVVRGSRPGSSTVYIDGMKVSDEMSTLPSLGIGTMEIYTGGIPAKYGDVTGGVIMMTTKGYFDLLSERKAQESRK